jgi:hypothetical protein
LPWSFSLISHFQSCTESCTNGWWRRYVLVVTATSLKNTFLKITMISLSDLSLLILHWILHWWLMKKICLCCSSNIFEKHILKNCHDLSLWSLTSNPALNPALMRERERKRCVILGRGWYGCKGVDDASEAYRSRAILICRVLGDAFRFSAKLLYLWNKDWCNVFSPSLLMKWTQVPSILHLSVGKALS